MAACATQHERRRALAGTPALYSRRAMMRRNTGAGFGLTKPHVTGYCRSPWERSANSTAAITDAPRPSSGRSRLAVSASSTPISAPARSMRFAEFVGRGRHGKAASEPVVLGIPLADRVGADRYRHDQIRDHPASRRQQWRGRNASIDGACASGGTGRRIDHPARHHQRGAFFRRCDHYTRAFGPVGHRGIEDRDSGVRALHRATDRCDPGRFVRRAIAWHRKGRGVFRSHHTTGRVVEVGTQVTI